MKIKNLFPADNNYKIKLTKCNAVDFYIFSLRNEVKNISFEKAEQEFYKLEEDEKFCFRILEKSFLWIKKSCDNLRTRNKKYNAIEDFPILKEYLFNSLTIPRNISTNYLFYDICQLSMKNIAKRQNTIEASKAFSLLSPEERNLHSFLFNELKLFLKIYNTDFTTFPLNLLETKNENCDLKFYHPYFRAATHIICFLIEILTIMKPKSLEELRNIAEIEWEKMTALEKENFISKSDKLSYQVVINQLKFKVKEIGIALQDQPRKILFQNVDEIGHNHKIYLSKENLMKILNGVEETRKSLHDILNCYNFNETNGKESKTEHRKIPNKKGKKTKNSLGSYSLDVRLKKKK